jgi:hypothetical protein
VTVIESRLDLRPTGDVPRELDLVGQRQHMVVARDIDVKHVEVIRLAQIICQVHEAGRGRLGHSIVYHDDVLIEIVFIFSCSCVEQRQKVVCKERENPN